MCLTADSILIEKDGALADLEVTDVRFWQRKLGDVHGTRAAAAALP